jgi:N-acetylglucosamine-6-phosphate deacetylase
MATIVKKAVEYLNIDLPTASRLASTNAAAFLGLENEMGRIAAGVRADFVLLDDTLSVRQTFIGGVP